MTQVNFYTLARTEPEARLQFVCRLTEKAYSLGHQIHIHTDSEQQSKVLDDLLWQYSATSFIPHQIAGSDTSTAGAVSLGVSLSSVRHGDLLINLTNQACQVPDPFNRINEVISGDDKSLERGRQRYRFYKEKGCQVEAFKL